MASFKRLICLILALLLCLVFAVACKDDEEETSSSSSTEEPSTDTSVPTETPSEEEVVTSIREGENMNPELGDGWTVVVPPNYQPQTQK